MAESILISLAYDILTNIGSDAIKRAYEQGVSIWEAKDDLVKLKETIGTLQCVIVDAEKKQEGSESVRNWIKKLKGVMYDAEDLFDEVAADDLLEEYTEEGCLEKQVWVFCSKFNPCVSRYSVAKRVKAIRGKLDDISTSMAQLGFVQVHPNDPSSSVRSEKYTARCFMGEKSVIGRDEEKNVILKMLSSELSDTDISGGPVVIAIDGIGGMGKTTLAHLIYKHKEVENNFEKRWFACISRTSSEIEVIEKIYQPMCDGGTYNGLSEVQLIEKIEESIKGKKYLLVLDDVWEDDRARWENRKSLLSCGAKGSKIIVTTRLPSVVKAMGAVGTYNLKGLSEEGSWNLFKSLAFDSSYGLTDLRREEIGRELLKRCRSVPLAIRCMGSLLHNKTIQEWEEIERAGLPIIEGEHNYEIMSILKLGYNNLPSKLKQCFTYCSLFPKDYRYDKMELIGQWVAQGYIKIGEGEFSFMHLLRKGFFQEALEDEFGLILSCKMHDIMHDLAMHLGGEEIIMMSGKSLKVSSSTRHVNLMVDGEEGGLWNIPTPLLDIKSIRTFSLRGLSPNLDQLCSNFKLLRTLKLSSLGIEHIPPSIGELKLVRYLDLSNNEFEELPDSVANLVNLLVLDINGCSKFKVWPHNFKKLIKLWSLKFGGRFESRLMPEGIGGMLNLQYLSYFKVAKGGDLDELNGLLKHLRGYLPVRFCEEMEVEDGLNWQLPADVSLESLNIESYPGYSMRGWGNNNCSSKLLVRVKVKDCGNVKYLPHFSCLPNLKCLVLRRLLEIEFMEEKEVSEYSNTTSTSLFYPCLEVLELDDLPKLKGWRRKVAASFPFLEFPSLFKLDIKECPNLESFPQCPNLKEFNLIGDISSTNLFSYTYPSLHKLYILFCGGLEKLHLKSPHLQGIEIKTCEDLMSIELVVITPEPSLRHLEIDECKQLKSLGIEEHVIAGLEEMKIRNCSVELSLKLSKTKDKSLFVEQGLPKFEGCKLDLCMVGGVILEQAFSLSSVREIKIEYCMGPMSLRGVAHASIQKYCISYSYRIESLHIPSPHLREVYLSYCNGLISAEFEAPTCISIVRCYELKNLRIAHPNTLKEFTLESSSSEVAGVDWGSIPNLIECSSIREVKLTGMDCVFIERLLSSSTFKSTGSVTLALPASLEKLSIEGVDGLKILNIQSQHLTCLSIKECSQLTNVRIVNPISLIQLEFVNCPELGQVITGADLDSFSNLEHLEPHPMPPPEELPECLLQRQALGHLQITQGWRREVAAEATSTSSCLEFSNLSKLDIEKCRNLESFPQCPSLQEFNLIWNISSTSLFSYTYPSLRKLYIFDYGGLEKLHLASPHLQSIKIINCGGLMTIELAGITPETSLRYLEIKDCGNLRSLCTEEHVIAGLEEMKIEDCPELSLKLSEAQGKRLLVQQGLPKVAGCKLRLCSVGSVILEQALSLPSIREITIRFCTMPMSLWGVPHASLEKLTVAYVSGLKTLSISSPLLRELAIEGCSELTNVSIANPTALTELKLLGCPELIQKLTDMEYWDSLPNLTYLELLPMPPREELPECLLRRQALRHLYITQPTMSWG